MARRIFNLPNFIPNYALYLETGKVPLYCLQLSCTPFPTVTLSENRLVQLHRKLFSRRRGDQRNGKNKPALDQSAEFDLKNIWVEDIKQKMKNLTYNLKLYDHESFVTQEQNSKPIYKQLSKNLK